MQNETPGDLSELEYARHILEEVLGWPAKGNIELIADCIRAVSKSRKLPLVKAHGYIVRAIGLAKKQNIEVDRWFFQEGKYTSVRPPKVEAFKHMQKIDLDALRTEQSSPEWQELSRKAREKLAEIAKGSRMK